MIKLADYIIDLELVDRNKQIVIVFNESETCIRCGLRNECVCYIGELPEKIKLPFGHLHESDFRVIPVIVKGVV